MYAEKMNELCTYIMDTYHIMLAAIMESYMIPEEFMDIKVPFIIEDINIMDRFHYKFDKAYCEGPRLKYDNENVVLCRNAKFLHEHLCKNNRPYLESTNIKELLEIVLKEM